MSPKRWSKEQCRYLREHEVRHVIPSGIQRLRFRRIVREVSDEFQCPPDRLLRSTRGGPEEARARQVLMYMLCRHLGLSFTKTGAATNRYRKTVSHGVNTVSLLRSTHHIFDNRLRQIDYACKASS